MAKFIFVIANIDILTFNTKIGKFFLSKLSNVLIIISFYFHLSILDFLINILMYYFFS